MPHPVLAAARPLRAVAAPAARPSLALVARRRLAAGLLVLVARVAA